MNSNGDIRIAAAVIVDSNGRTLLVRKRGTSAFMQAGGKVGPDESPAEALAREIREELDCGLAGPPVPLGCFRSPAANEPGRSSRRSCSLQCWKAKSVPPEKSRR